MNPFIIDTITDEIADVLGRVIAFIPDLFAAVIILILGIIVGGLVGKVVTQAGLRTGIDRNVQGTVLGSIFGDEPDSVSRIFGLIVKYYIILVAVFVAADYLGLDMVSQWLETALSYVPALIAGLLIIVVGLFVADKVAEIVGRSITAQRTGLSHTFAGATKAFLYFIVIVIGLDTMGIDVTILETFAQAFAFALGLALALAFGIAFGWGSKDYVAENIDGWFSESRGIVDSEDDPMTNE